MAHQVQHWHTFKLMHISRVHLQTNGTLTVSEYLSVLLSVQEKTAEVSDWRKNVEAMSGMEGRKKMFDAAKGPNQ